ncbi:MAG: GNAT family N-acetyltransferase [Chitinophagaceae bacterium]
MQECRIVAYQSPEYEQQVQLRYDVLRAPLGLRFTPEYLQKDEKDVLFGCFLDGELIGCCQLTVMGEGVYQLRQMAVAPDMQGRNVGTELVAFLENYVTKITGKKIVLHARQVALGFYKKLGYRMVGEEFEEVGIPHYAMEKTLL